MGERRLEYRPQQRVVTRDDRPGALLRVDLVAEALHERDINEAVEGIGWRLDEDHCDAPLPQGLITGETHALLVDAILETDGMDVEPRKCFLYEDFRAAVQRATVQYDVARPDVAQNCRCNGRHAG